MNKGRDRLSTEADWSSYFEEGSHWEANHGPEHTRLYAEAFCKYTRVELESGQSILDSSCALGDALPVLHNHFPKAQLHACDISEVAIRRCKEKHPGLADYYVAAIEEISSMYDVIYSSATLEHFTDYKEKSQALLQHCNILCIFVPYNQTRFGKDLESDQYNDHVVTFREQSFDFLIEEGFAKRVRFSRDISVPKACSWTLKMRIIQTLKNIIRLLVRRPIVRNQKMILFEIERNQAIRSSA